MKIDLCKLFNVEEGEEFKFEYEDGSIRDIKYRVVNNIMEWSEIGTHYEGDYHLACFSLNDANKVKNIIKLPKKKEFSQDTLNFFKCIDKKYEWIAKDINDDVHAFCEKPIKESRCWFYDGRFYISKAFNQAIFNQILWEDEEPVYIDDYVER